MLTKLWKVTCCEARISFLMKDGHNIFSLPTNEKLIYFCFSVKIMDIFTLIFNLNQEIK
jgi:hypothetical protein